MLGSSLCLQVGTLTVLDVFGTLCVWKSVVGTIRGESLMLDKVDITNAIHILEACISQLEDPIGKNKGTRYVEAKQQVFLLKIAKQLGCLNNNHLENLMLLDTRLREWEKSGGVRTDEKGNLL